MHREDLAWSKWYHLDGEIVGADERHALFRQPERAAFIDPGLSLEVNTRISVHTVDPAGTNEDGIPDTERYA